MLANVLKSSLIAAAIAAGSAHAQISDGRDGYVMSGTQEPVRSAYDDYWRTGYWVPQRASYSAEVLFEFERAELGAGGRKLLDDLAQKLLAIDPEKVTATAHADRIGGAEYNERLSARRAEAIRVYLIEKGVPEKLLHFESRGAREPVSACEVMGPETKHNAKLVACLQPDRRVEIEMVGRQKP